MPTGSQRPSFAEVEAAMPQIAGGGAIVWENPETGRLEVLAERDHIQRRGGCATDRPPERPILAGVRARLWRLGIRARRRRDAARSGFEAPGRG